MNQRITDHEVRRDFFGQLSTGARATLLGAIFFTFAPFGIVPEIAHLYPSSSPFSIAAWALYSGTIAAGFAAAFMWRRTLLYLVVPGQLLGPPLIVWATIASGAPGRSAPIDWHALSLGYGCMALVIVGYVLFVRFIRGEAARSIRMQAELNLAREIHHMLVPPLTIEAPAIEVFARSVPSMEMGGDLIDAVRHPGGTLDLYLADVSGHGVRAGIVMAMVKSAIRMRLLADAPLPALLASLNEVLERTTASDMFATFVCLRFAADGRSVEYALAGHLPIVHIRAADGSLTLLPNDHLPLGLYTDEHYASQTVACAPGDLFAVFTDGLTEVMNDSSRQLGHERLAYTIHEHAREPLPRLFESVLDAVRRYGTQGDDQSLMLIRVR